MGGVRLLVGNGRYYGGRRSRELEVGRKSIGGSSVDAQNEDGLDGYRLIATTLDVQNYVRGSGWELSAIWAQYADS